MASYSTWEESADLSKNIGEFNDFIEYYRSPGHTGTRPKRILTDKQVERMQKSHQAYMAEHRSEVNDRRRERHAQRMREDPEYAQRRARQKRAWYERKVNNSKAESHKESTKARTNKPALSRPGMRHRERMASDPEYAQRRREAYRRSYEKKKRDPDHLRKQREANARYRQRQKTVSQGSIADADSGKYEGRSRDTSSQLSGKHQTVPS
ncbi:hypothetical protein [Bifidobacterium tibiigranuli]|uniref:hypothetical protein n=1 Tax=Bifidobacterium tibiigranuli TaxID=2172043 RepID=UPI002355B631|nr:hypothetical protein [Bifidobacterium tibiigranuli]MCH3973703.1 hypothetical protein [Bifidobacterium tibiigranuli]